MKTVTNFLCIIILLSIPMALLAASRDSYYDRPGDRGDLRIVGSVRSTDKHGGRMQLVIGNRTEQISFDRNVRCYSGNRRIDIDDLRRGEHVRIEGYRARGNELIALAIYLVAALDSNRRYDDYYYRDRGGYGNDSIRARVVKTTSIFSRTLRASDLEWRGGYDRILEVEVRKDALVMRDGRSISVHEIRNGEGIRARGVWTGRKFIANAVWVERSWGYDRDNDRDYNRDYGYRTYTGTVQDVNHDDLRLKIDTGPSKYEIEADRADVFRYGNRGDFRDIRKGDEVTVSGSRDDNRIYADRIEIVGYGRR